MKRPLALIIEDQINLAVLYEDTLRLVGYDVKSIHDGLEALNYLQIHDVPNLIILDVNLPTLSGYDIHQHLRSNEKYADTPVVILTANSLMVDRMRSKVTANDYLFVKPVSVKSLQDLARAVKPSGDSEADEQEETDSTNTSGDEHPTETEIPTMPFADDRIGKQPVQDRVDPKAETLEHKAVAETDDDDTKVHSEEQNGENGATDEVTP